MTIGTLKTQGTELFFVDTIPTVDVIRKVACPTGITGLGGAADQLDDTCLDSQERTFKRGLGNPGTVTVPINFIPSNATHKALTSLQADGRNVYWLIGLSDGTAAPATSNTAGAPIPPAAPNRTSIRFYGYVSDFNIDIATNEIVRATLTIQRSGPVEYFWNGPINPTT